jgi:hypothetical protein
MIDALAAPMIDALTADGPDPAHADALMLFGRFVGAWSIDAELIAADGTRSSHRAEWLFGWALEGRAVQDVLISPPRAEPGERFEYGSTVRFYDPEMDAWRITWITPVQRAVRSLVARADGDGILLEGIEPDGTHLRWTFTEITGETFLWRGYVSTDGGATFRLNEEMRARRA